MDTVNIVLRLESTGETADTIGWPRFKEFFDSFSKALAAMPSGARPDELLPCAITSGSVKVQARVPRHAKRGVETLRRGPTRDWTPRMHRETEPLYRFMRSESASLRLGVRPGHRHLFVVPPAPVEPPVWTQMETLRGEVFRAGGKDGIVEIRLTFDKMFQCNAGQDLAFRLGHWLYRIVEVSGRTKRDPVSHALLEFDIVDFDVIDPRSPAQRQEQDGDRTQLELLSEDLRRILGPDFTLDIDELRRQERE